MSGFPGALGSSRVCDSIAKKSKENIANVCVVWFVGGGECLGGGGGICVYREKKNRIKEIEKKLFGASL
jgi:hypothetical protein